MEISAAVYGENERTPVHAMFRRTLYCVEFDQNANIEATALT